MLPASAPKIMHGRRSRTAHFGGTVSEREKKKRERKRERENKRGGERQREKDKDKEKENIKKTIIRKEKDILPAQTPNSMGRNTWAEKLQALLLSNCTLRYLVLMAAAHKTCYQHFISKTSMANAVRSKSGLGALCVGPRRSPSSDPRATHPARRVPPPPGENPKVGTRAYVYVYIYRERERERDIKQTESDRERER